MMARSTTEDGVNSIVTGNCTRPVKHRNKRYSIIYKQLSISSYLRCVGFSVHAELLKAISGGLVCSDFSWPTIFYRSSFFDRVEVDLRETRIKPPHGKR
jgi:hypothetical protein